MQEDWIRHLPLAEYVYNLASHAGTAMSPFFALTGRNSVPFQLHPHKSQASLSAEEMVSEILQIQEFLATKLVKAQDRQAVHYDKKH